MKLWCAAVRVRAGSTFSGGWGNCHLQANNTAALPSGVGRWRGWDYDV